jgi:two-component system chemotaxis response regulator CheB
VDYCLALERIPAVVRQLVAQPAHESPAVPEELKREARIMTGHTKDPETVESLGDKTGLVCPECGGSLYEIRDNQVQRYRCHVGHAYTAHSLLDDQNEAVERALWAALRSLEDRARIYQKLALHSDSRGFANLASDYNQQAQETSRHADNLRNLLNSVNLKPQEISPQES